LIMVGTAQGRLCPPYAPVNAGEKNFFTFLILVPQTSLILPVSCPMRGRFLEAILSADRARAGRTGAPERSAWWPRWSAGRRCVLRHWARAAGVISCARRSDFFASGVCRLRTLAPPAAPPPRAVREGFCKPRTHSAARIRRCGCLKSMNQKLKRDAATHSASYAG
jgi:hypothetical protein